MDDMVCNWALANTQFRKHAVVQRNAEVTHSSMMREGIVGNLVSLAGDNGKPVFNRLKAKKLVSAYRNALRNGGIAIYWDIESVPPPVGHTAAAAALGMCKLLAITFGPILEFKVYCDTKNSPRSEADWIGLSDAGAEVVHVCHMNRKEVADQMVIVDVMRFALGNRVASLNARATQSTKRAKPAICIIKGDSDFNFMLSKLDMNGFHTVSITGSSHNVRSVNKQAAEHFAWADFGLTPIQVSRESASATDSAPQTPTPEVDMQRLTR